MTGSGSHRTTLLGGVGLLIAALLQLLPLVASWIPTFGASVDALRSAPAQVVEMVVLLAACVILAFGFPGEKDVVGGSKLGRAGFLIWGLSIPLQYAFSYFVLGNLGLAGSPAFVGIGTAIGFLPLAGIMLAGVSVARAGILSGYERWALLVVAAAQVIVVAMSTTVWAVLATTQGEQGADISWTFSIAAIPLVLLMSAGVSFMVTGRTAAITQRVRGVYAAWVSSTP